VPRIGASAAESFSAGWAGLGSGLGSPGGPRGKGLGPPLGRRPARRPDLAVSWGDGRCLPGRELIPRMVCDRNVGRGFSPRRGAARRLPCRRWPTKRSSAVNDRWFSVRVGPGSGPSGARAWHGAGGLRLPRLALTLFGPVRPGMSPRSAVGDSREPAYRGVADFYCFSCALTATIGAKCGMW
jgi:hypothetical protein